MFSEDFDLTNCPFCHSEPQLQTGAEVFCFCPKCGLRTSSMAQEGEPRIRREYFACLFWNAMSAGILERLVGIKVENPTLYTAIAGPTAQGHDIAWAYAKLNSSYAVRRRCWPESWHLLKAHDNDYRLVKEHVADMLLTKDWGEAKYSWLPSREDSEATNWELFSGAKEGVDY